MKQRKADQLCLMLLVTYQSWFGSDLPRSHSCLSKEACKARVGYITPPGKTSSRPCHHPPTTTTTPASRTLISHLHPCSLVLPMLRVSATTTPTHCASALSSKVSVCTKPTHHTHFPLSLRLRRPGRRERWGMCHKLKVLCRVQGSRSHGVDGEAGGRSINQTTSLRP
jgi:hypothetical protein